MKHFDAIKQHRRPVPSRIDASCKVINRNLSSAGRIICSRDDFALGRVLGQMWSAMIPYTIGVHLFKIKITSGRHLGF